MQYIDYEERGGDEFKTGPRFGASKFFESVRVAFQVAYKSLAYVKVLLKSLESSVLERIGIVALL